MICPMCVVSDQIFSMLLYAVIYLLLLQVWIKTLIKLMLRNLLKLKDRFHSLFVDDKTQQHVETLHVCS